MKLKDKNSWSQALQCLGNTQTLFIKQKEIPNARQKPESQSSLVVHEVKISVVTIKLTRMVINHTLSLSRFTPE